MQHHKQPDTEQGQPPSKAVPWGKILLGACLLLAGYFIYARFGSALSLEALAERESSLRAYQSDHPWWVAGAAFGIYVLVTGFSFPGAALLTLVLGWYFGFWQAFVMVSFASTSGATMAFLISRFLLRDSIQSRFESQLKRFNEALQREGAYYLFTLRLIPVVPFFVINLVMGLTHLPARTFWWVSQLGMLPGTAVYVYAGSQFPSLKTLAETGAKGILSPSLLFAFALLGVFPILVKKGMAKWGKSGSTPS